MMSAKQAKVFSAAITVSQYGREPIISFKNAWTDSTSAVTDKTSK